MFVGFFAGKIQKVGIPVGTNRAPLLARHLSLLIRSGIHTVFVLDGKEASRDTQ